MSLSTVARIALARTAIGAAVGRVPFVKQAYARHAGGQRNNPGLQWGVFESYSAAMMAVPQGRTGGWDNQGAASIWTHSIDPVRPSTYPVLFWLRHLLQQNTRLTDLGGSVGLTFYAYRRYATLPPGARWTVVEVPHIAAEGARIAQREEASALAFVTEANEAPGEILLAAGALQYMQNSVPGLLENLSWQPGHILVNKIPLTRQPSFWTLQNFGPAVAPYHIFNETAFLDYFIQRGYVLADRWDVADISCDIPFHPNRSVTNLTGLYFKRAD